MHVKTGLRWNFLWRIFHGMMTASSILYWPTKPFVSDFELLIVRRNLSIWVSVGTRHKGLQRSLVICWDFTKGAMDSVKSYFYTIIQRQWDYSRNMISPKRWWYSIVFALALGIFKGKISFFLSSSLVLHWSQFPVGSTPLLRHIKQITVVFMLYFSIAKFSAL